MKDPDTIRVETVWPVELHARVRDQVGGRRLSLFVRDAVQEKLARDSAGESPAQAVEVESGSLASTSTADLPDADAQVELEPDQPPTAFAVGDEVEVAGITFTKISDDPFPGIDTSLANAIRNDLDAEAQHDRTEQIAQQFGLQRASELSKPQPVAPTADDDTSPAGEEDLTPPPGMCPTCHSPLIAGECWSCAM